MAIPLRLTVNGAAVEVADVPDSERLLDTLRWIQELYTTSSQLIVNQLQDIFNLLPNTSVEELDRAFAVKTKRPCACHG